MKGTIIPKERFLELHAKHITGISLKDISKEHDFKYITLITGFKRLGLEIHIATNEQRKRNRVQENWFANIDSQVKAYYLGLLMADGYVNRRLVGNKSARVCIKLQKRDSYLVQQFVDLVQPGANLYTDKNSIGCQIPSNTMCQDLAKLGLVERKTIHGECFPELPEEMSFHFLRGYFDGDGSITLGAKNRSTIYICCANIEFLQKVQSFLQKFEIKSTIHIEDRSKAGFRNMYTLHINDRQKFYVKLYQDASIFMIRKKLKYDHVNTVLTRKNWQRRA